MNTILMMILVSLLTACSTHHVNTSSRLNKKTAMTENKPTPQFTQRQLLTKLLAMMEIAHSEDDFTPERVSQVFGVKLRTQGLEEGEFLLTENLTSDWRYYFDKSRGGISKEHWFFSIELKFYKESNSGAIELDMSEICDMNIEEFTRKAEALGYTSYPLFQREIQIPGVLLERDNLRLRVYEARHPSDTVSPRCIRRIVI